tara:strand:+ start:299 stop:760 length:462 start_codon:yes stop_codon:yes gene_type:complete
MNQVETIEIKKDDDLIKLEKVKALKYHLTLNDEETNQITLEDGEYFHFGDKEFLVLTDEEAEEQASDYIKNSVWAFNSSFLSSHTGIREDVFKLLSDKCEDSNDAVLSMIKDFDSFVRDAISSDGRGHFIATYDHGEYVEEINNTEYFIYRTN